MFGCVCMLASFRRACLEGGTLVFHMYIARVHSAACFKDTSLYTSRVIG